jgi:putative salt-induced outer membrane protein
MSLVLASLLLLSTPSDTITPKPANSVRFTGDAGYVATSGNSSVQTLNVGSKVSAKLGNWAFNQQFAVVHGKNSGATVTSLWRGSIRADYSLTTTVTTYGSLTYERNIFAGLDSRVSTVGGVSAVVAEDERNRLALEAGVSLTAQRGVGPRGRDLDFLGGRAATSYAHRIGPKASFTQLVEFLPNFRESEDLRVNSESTLLAPITRQIGLKLSFVIRYDGLPEAGFMTTDRLFTSGVQVSL